jgi:hypothetical protein
MEGFTQYCIWFLFASVVVELAWKGWKKYQEDIDVVCNNNNTEDKDISLSPVVRRSKRLNKDKDLEGEKKNKD